MRKLLLFFAILFMPFVAQADMFYTLMSESLGSGVTSAIYASHASCWSCGYILDVVDLFSSISLSLFEDLRLPIITLLAITLVGWIVYKIISGLFDLSAPTPTSLFQELAPKLFAMIIVLPLLLAPTPKFIYNYTIEPLMDLGASYGTKVMEIVSGQEVQSYCLMKYAESKASGTENHTFSPSFRQSLICMVSQSHQVNAIGITLGTVLVQESFSTENRYLYVIPNLAMGLGGGLIAITYFVALLVFPFYVVGSLFSLGFVLAFLPFALYSFIITRGGSGPGFFENVFSKSLDTVVTASLTMLFLPFMLSLSHIVFQTALDAELFGYEKLVKLIQTGDTAQIANELSFGTKSMLFLAFIAILNIYLIASTSKIVGWFGSGADYSKGEQLFERTRKGVKNSLKWINDKRKSLFGKKKGDG